MSNAKGRNKRQPGERLIGAPGAEEGRHERALKALDLRVAGASYRRIAAELGVNERTAYYDVQTELEALDAVKAKKAEKLREIELDRCDKLTIALWPKARNGDEKAVRAIVAVMDRRAKLLGIDAPAKIEHGGVDGAALAFTLKLDRANA